MKFVHRFYLLTLPPLFLVATVLLYADWKDFQKRTEELSEESKLANIETTAILANNPLMVAYFDNVQYDLEKEAEIDRDALRLMFEKVFAISGIHRNLARTIGLYSAAGKPVIKVQRPGAAPTLPLSGLVGDYRSLDAVHSRIEAGRHYTVKGIGSDVDANGTLDPAEVQGYLLMESQLPMSDIHGAELFRLYRDISIIGACMLLLAALLFLSGRMVSQPLGQLARQADLAAGSDPAGTFSAGSGIQELETLARTLNQMLQVIGEKQRGLVASGARIREQLDFRQTLIDTIAIPVFFKDREKRYLGCNRAFEEVFGLNRDELIGKSAKDIAPPELALVYTRADDELLSGANPQGQQRYESQVLDRQGRHRDVIFHKAVFRDATGRVAGVVGAYVDISDRRKAEKELELHREHLEELVRERTVALEEANRRLAAEVEERRLAERKLQESAERLAVLLREVNHRVKNNLSAIVSILHMEADEAKRIGDQGRLATLGQLERRVQGLSVVHSLLSSTRWQPLRLSSLCREIIQTSFAGLTGGAATATVCDSPVLVGSSQAHHLALIINELAVNSVKHRPADTKHIGVDVGIDAQGEEIVLTYRDDGAGYPPPVLAGEAGGLGLELVKGIVRHSLRGTVTLKTDGGAVTSLRFPAMRQSDREVGL